MTELLRTKLMDIFEKLRNIRGLSNFNILTEEDKDKIREIEDENNFGVFECINRDVCIMMTHNDEFRDPGTPLSILENNEEVFIPIPFPEVLERDTVSSSPRKEVHEFLAERFSLDLEEKDATLLIGFDLE